MAISHGVCNHTQYGTFLSKLFQLCLRLHFPAPVLLLQESHSNLPQPYKGRERLLKAEEIKLFRTPF